MDSQEAGARFKEVLVLYRRENVRCTDHESVARAARRAAMRDLDRIVALVEQNAITGKISSTFQMPSALDLSMFEVYSKGYRQYLRQCLPVEYKIELVEAMTRPLGAVLITWS